jgi:hypothetical protein
MPPPPWDDASSDGRAFDGTRAGEKGRKAEALRHKGEKVRQSGSECGAEKDGEPAR